MPITVVTTRDDSGAPSTRDVYAVGERYKIGNDGLQIFSARSLVALYSSGNWLSVYVDDPVSVEPRPSEDPSDVAAPEPDAISGSDIDLSAAVDFDTDTDGAAEPDVPAAEPDLALPTAVDNPDVEVDVDLGVPTAVGGHGSVSRPEATTPVGPVVSEAMRAQSPTLRPVVFAPKIYRAARGADSPSPSAVSDSPPSRLRAVAFRPKVYRAAREAASTTERPDGTDPDASPASDDSPAE